jgi:3-carboxy-cis,cis-muconate cycloisomerase
MMREATERACVATGDVLSRLVLVCSGLRVDPVAMLRNLNITGGLIVSEAVMLELGDVVGRQTAHDVVYAAAQQAASTAENFAAVLGKDDRVAAHLSRDAIDALLDPTRYLGLCSSMAVTAATDARTVASALFQMGAGPVSQETRPAADNHADG